MAGALFNVVRHFVDVVIGRLQRKNQMAWFDLGFESHQIGCVDKKNMYILGWKIGVPFARCVNILNDI